MLREDPRCSTANPVFRELDQPGIGRYLVPGSPLDFECAPRAEPVRAPLLGEHTDEVLAELGVSAERLADLAARGVIVCAGAA
jgi:2-methylfumaryl-CoA isomerase